MARSMTAYGRSTIITDIGLFLIEVHSVNRKSLDISINLPKELLSLDIDLRKKMSEKVKLGNVTMRITRERSKGCLPSVMPDMETMKKLYQDWEGCAKDLGYEPRTAIPFNVLLSYALGTAPTLQVYGNEMFKKELFAGVDEAMDAFLQMKQKEGGALIADMASRTKKVAEYVEQISQKTMRAPQKYREKLQERLEELKAITEGDEERLMRELVIFADRVDVTEEITRLRSHIAQFEETLGSEKQRLGRELEFLIQEMNREVNTIGAKSQDALITKHVVAIKSDLEKVREQIQNIE